MTSDAAYSAPSKPSTPTNTGTRVYQDRSFRIASGTEPGFRNDEIEHVDNQGNLRTTTIGTGETRSTRSTCCFRITR